MAEEKYTLDLGPIFKALELLICEDGGSSIDVDEFLKVAGTIGEITQKDPAAVSEVYRQIGVCAFILLARRIAPQKIAANLIKRVQDGKG